MKAIQFGAACAALALLGALIYLSGVPLEEAAVSYTSAAQSEPGVAAADDPSVPAAPLFPELEKTFVTALSVTTPERSFSFACSREGRVSVNGQKADADVFATLLAQISTLPVASLAAFTPTHDPLMTLNVVTEDGQEFIASFYHGERSDAYIRIICDPQGSPHYSQTDGWRIGTLLLACDGTRIQDESGRETPMQ